MYLRDPNSYTPMLHPDPSTGQFRSLLLGRNADENRRQIGKFSAKDAEAFPRYEDWLQRIVDAVQPLVDSPPVDLNGTTFFQGEKQDMQIEYRLHENISRGVTQVYSSSPTAHTRGGMC